MSITLSRRRTPALLLAALSMTTTALADLPGAVDFVPADAGLVVVLRDMHGFKTNVENMLTSLHLPEGAVQLGPLDEVMAVEGLNTHGSAAIAVLPIDGKFDPDNEKSVIAIVPVSNYGAFVGALGGKADAGVSEVQIDGETNYMRDLGGGFALLASTKDRAEAGLAKGQSKAHADLWGANCLAVADSSQLLLVANIQQIKPMIEEGLKGFREQMAMFQQMAGQAGGGQQAGMMIIDKAMAMFTEDGQSAVIGVTIDQSGLLMDYAVQLRAGSKSAQFMGDGKGNAPSLSARIPNEPYLFAMAMDTSSAATKKSMKELAEEMENAGGGQGAGPMDLLRNIDEIDGMAFLMGVSPAGLMGGGLLSNTAQFVKTKDPAGYVKGMQASYEEMNGKKQNGITFQTTFEPGAQTIDGKPVSAWSMKMQFDPSNPQAAQMQMGMMMIFGPTGGMQGYVAQAEGGTVTTFSKASALMSKCLASASKGDGLASNPGIQQVAERLPQGRTFEAYIGVKGWLDAVLPMAAMMGAGPIDAEIPSDLPPIGIGALTSAGGARLTIFAPQPVIKTFSDIAQSVGGGQAPEPAPADQGGGKPRF